MNNSFLQQFSDNIKFNYTCFDRVIIRGYIRSLFFEAGIVLFLRAMGFFASKWEFYFTILMGFLFTIVLGIQLTISIIYRRHVKPLKFILLIDFQDVYLIPF